MYGIKKIIQDIYEMREHNLLTPHSLVENARLENYSHVKYYMKEEYFIAEMECYCDDGINRKFIYRFDLENKLQKVTATPGNIFKVDVLFDRKIELETLVKKYNEVINNQVNKISS